MQVRSVLVLVLATFLFLIWFLCVPLSEWLAPAELEDQWRDESAAETGTVAIAWRQNGNAFTEIKINLLHRTWAGVAYWSAAPGRNYGSGEAARLDRKPNGDLKEVITPTAAPDDGAPLTADQMKTITDWLKTVPKRSDASTAPDHGMKIALNMTGKEEDYWFTRDTGQTLVSELSGMIKLQF